MRMVHDVGHLTRSPYNPLRLSDRLTITLLLVFLQIEDTQQNQSGWLFGRGGMLHLPACFVGNSITTSTVILVLYLTYV